MKIPAKSHFDGLRNILHFSAIYFLFPLWNVILSLWKIIYRYKIKLSATVIATPIAILTFYYAYFINPDMEYFSKKSAALALERVYLVYMNTSCDKMEEAKDKKLKKWHENEFISAYQKLAEIFAQYVSNLDNPDREGREIYSHDKQFQMYVANQIKYVKENKVCNPNRYSSTHLKEWQWSISATFPSSFGNFNTFYYKKYNLHNLLLLTEY